MVCPINGPPTRLSSQNRPIRLELSNARLSWFYQYSFSATCIWRCVLAWALTTPKAVESRLVKFDVEELKTVRLKMLNASQRKSIRRVSPPSGNDFPTLRFSLNVGKERTLGL